MADAKLIPAQIKSGYSPVQSLQRTPFLTEEARQSKRRHRKNRRAHSAHASPGALHIAYHKHEEEAWIIDDDPGGANVVKL